MCSTPFHSRISRVPAIGMASCRMRRAGDLRSANARRAPPAVDSLRLQPAVGELLNAICQPALEEAAVVARRLLAENVRHSALSSGSAMVFSAARRVGIGSVMQLSVVDVSHDRSGQAGSVANFLYRWWIVARRRACEVGSGPAQAGGRPRRAARGNSSPSGERVWAEHSRRPALASCLHVPALASAGPSNALTGDRYCTCRETGVRQVSSGDYPRPASAPGYRGPTSPRTRLARRRRHRSLNQRGWRRETTGRLQLRWPVTLGKWWCPRSLFSESLFSAKSQGLVCLEGD